MKTVLTMLLILSLASSLSVGSAQTQQQEIDSLIVLFKGAHREWNEYAREFIRIGEPAVPALIAVLEDKNLSQWTRRITAMTLNDIHSESYIKTALKILTDRNEDPTLRNQVTNGLKGHDLSYASEELWNLYKESSSEWFRSNIAHILVTSDTALAYQAYREIYDTYDGHLKRNALLNMVQLRPGEATMWYLEGLQTGDWMTANLAMDSLIVNRFVLPEKLTNLFHLSDTPEEVRWRIVFIMGNRILPETLPLLIHALRDPSWLVCNEAAVQLSCMPEEQVIPAMEGLLNDSNPRVVKNTQWVIRRVKGNG